MRQDESRIFHYITTRTPYVVMKYAMTADGKIATKTGASRWITGEEARNFVHQMRHGYMGIMAGIGTVLADDPMLNVRLQGRKSPVRIICDSALRIPLNSRICRTAKEYRTIVACAVERGDVGEQTAQKIAFLEHLGIQVVSLPDSDKKVDLKKLTEYLGGQGIDSVLLEGGAELNDSALRAGIVKEVKVFIAPKLFGGAGAKSPVTGIGVETPGQSACLKLEKISPIGEDLLLEYRIKDSPALGAVTGRRTYVYWNHRRNRQGAVRNHCRKFRKNCHIGVKGAGENKNWGQHCGKRGLSHRYLHRKDGFTADIMAETVRRSNLGRLGPGDQVNLERAMAADGRFGGHLISGILTEQDGAEHEKEENAIWVTIETTPKILRLIIEKGSVCIDGISLTVAQVGKGFFQVSIIPHTGAETTLLKNMTAMW